MNTRRFRAVPLIAMITALAAGCAAVSASQRAASQSDQEDITVAAIPAVDLAGLYIAQDQGLFARQGLQVAIESIPSSQAIVADQLKGQVDISAGSYVGYIAAQAAGARFRILAEASTLLPYTRVLVTPADSPITSISEMAGKKIGVNGTNSIGTLLISMLLAEHQMSPGKVRFVTDQGGFPTMPGQLQHGAWGAAFLAEPYITAAGQQYGDQVLADLDQGGALNLPIDGYVATGAWVARHPETAAAFVRAIEAGQAIADHDSAAVRAAMASYDRLPPVVTTAMALPGFPVGPVSAARIQSVARDMLQFGILGAGSATDVDNGTLVESMVGPGA